MTERCPECAHETAAHLEDGFCGVCISEGDSTGRCAVLICVLPNGPLVVAAFEQVARAHGGPEDVAPIYVLTLSRTATAAEAALRVVETLGLNRAAADYYLTDTAGYVIHGSVNLAPWNDRVLLLGSRDPGAWEIP